MYSSRHRNENLTRWTATRHTSLGIIDNKLRGPAENQKLKSRGLAPDHAVNPENIIQIKRRASQQSGCRTAGLIMTLSKFIIFLHLATAGTNPWQPNQSETSLFRKQLRRADSGENQFMKSADRCPTFPSSNLVPLVQMRNVQIRSDVCSAVDNSRANQAMFLRSAPPMPRASPPRHFTSHQSIMGLLSSTDGHTQTIFLAPGRSGKRPKLSRSFEPRGA